MVAPKVSIVIPVYGVEAYMERCARSLFEQTLDSLEYIFVNDCTPDDSMSVLRRVLAEYPERGEQVRIINLPRNMGAAKAREVGIKAATGEYIIHCDSDDWVERDAYALMYVYAQAGDYDVVIGEYCEHDGSKCLRRVRQTLGEDALKTVIAEPVKCSLYNKFVKRDLLRGHKIYYPKCHMQEDNVLCVQMFYYARRIGYLQNDKPVYYYYINPQSISHEDSDKSHLKRWKDAQTNVKIVCEFANDKGIADKYKRELLMLKANARGFLMPLMRKDNRFYAQWFHSFPELNHRYWRLSNVQWSLRLVFLLTLLGLYPAIYKLIHRGHHRKLKKSHEME